MYMYYSLLDLLVYCSLVSWYGIVSYSIVDIVVKIKSIVKNTVFQLVAHKTKEKFGKAK